MRYRIQIQPMLGAVMCVVAQYDEYRHQTTVSTKMYMLEDTDVVHGGLVEILGELQRMIGEVSP